MSYTNQPPGVIDYITPAKPTNAAPPSNAPADVTVNPPANVAPPANTGAAPASNATTPPTTAPAVPVPPGGGYAGVPSPMQSTFTPAFTGLTGAGNTLATLTASAADATAGKVVVGVVNGQHAFYQVRAGTDATALPGIVQPANFDPVNNPVVFVQL